MSEELDYRSVIGKLNFLEKSTRPDIAYAVHQCARFCSNPTELHAEAVKQIARYLIGTRDKGLVLKPKEQSIDLWVDSDYAGNWHKSHAPFDSNTSRSRTGYIITLASCPVVWGSKIQVEISLSSTEAEYVALSQSMREVIPLMGIIAETTKHMQVSCPNIPTVHCKVFKDKSGALEMANVLKMRPRTKHINVKYHHFREQVRRGKISIHKVDSEAQLANAHTKPLSVSLFE